MNQPSYNGQHGSKVPYPRTHYFGSHVIPEDHVLSRLYASQPGVQVSMVARNKRTRIPTVRELIEQLSKKHERLLQEELEAERNAPQVSSDSSTTTSSGPYATDILYGSDVEKSGAECRLGHAHHALGESERVREGRRDRSDHREQRKTLYSRDSLNTSTDSKGALERDDLGRSNASLLHPAHPKGNQFKPNGLRTSIVSKGRHNQDELVAMGTIWNPNAQSKPLRTFSVCTNSNTSAVSTPRRISSVGVPSATYKHVLGLPNSQQTTKSINNSLEPKYCDPLTGAPVQFQQRLAELSTLEAETVRYEKTRKLKKKPLKLDRDS